MILFMVPFIVSSCTINIIQTSTHGTASDVVDSDPTTRTDADVSIPGLTT